MGKLPYISNFILLFKSLYMVDITIIFSVGNGFQTVKLKTSWVPAMFNFLRVRSGAGFVSDRSENEVYTGIQIIINFLINLVNSLVMPIALFTSV